MSLAMSAAPFNDDNEYIQNTNASKRRSTPHNKTQKRSPNQQVDREKINNVLQTIHNSHSDDEDDEMGDFTPPSPPISAGVEKTIDAKESPSVKYLQAEANKRLGRGSENATEYSDGSLDLNNFESNYGNDTSNEEYYKRFVPNYPQPVAQGQIGEHNKPYYAMPSGGQQLSGGVDQNVLLEKLNYMIHLLEEQQDERVGSVTEEVVLYSFLGIFIIFLVDSFTRIGKYKR